MQNQFWLHRYTLLFFMVLFFSIGCDNERDRDPDGDRAPTDSSGKIVSTASIPGAHPFAGKLDTLWIDSATFIKFNNKAEFIFHFATDTITVHGWNNKGGNEPFDDTPTVQFIKGHQSNLSYGPETYFGNMGLKNIQTIKNMIRHESATYVIFAPEKDKRHVYYKVFLTKEPHMLLPKTLAPVPTNVSTNPSPPKQYN